VRDTGPGFEPEQQALAFERFESQKVGDAPRGTGLGGTLTNEGGDVRIDGTIAYTAPTLGIEATLAPGPDTPPTIARLIAMAGTPDSAGRVRIAWRGNVR